MIFINFRKILMKSKGSVNIYPLILHLEKHLSHFLIREFLI